MNTVQDRTNGVTIFYQRQVIATQEPIEEDSLFVHLVLMKHEEWIKDGKPLSGNGY